METEKLIVLAIVNTLTAVLSGIGGGGGGFISTPLLVFLGLTPQEAVASGKIGGLGVTFGSLKGLSAAKIHRWHIVLPLMGLATVIGLLTPFVIKNLDNELYRQLLGGIILAMIPVVVLKKVGVTAHEPKPWQKALAIPALVVAMSLQAIFSGGLGSLVVLALMGLVGMRALEANVTKRFSQVLLNSTIVLGLLGSGLIVWEVAGVLFVAGLIGGSIGARIAVKRGDAFVAYIFAVLMFISGLELIFG